jgi:hypothetical protein
MTRLEAVKILRWNVFSTFRGTHFHPRGFLALLSATGATNRRTIGKV